MFCPKCATQNLEGASYCRVCGANISLVPQALSGQLVQAREENAIETGRRGRRRKRGELSLDQAFKNVFMGFAFLLIAIVLSFSMGKGWWFWMLIPAFSMMGTGVAQYIRLKEERKRTFGPSGPMQPSIPPAPRVSSFPTRHTGELVPPPPSVTESTTRHLGAEAPTQHFDPSTETSK